jgi:hypothetical protein
MEVFSSSHAGRETDYTYPLEIVQTFLANTAPKYHHGLHVHEVYKHGFVLWKDVHQI